MLPFFQMGDSPSLQWGTYLFRGVSWGYFIPTMPEILFLIIEDFNIGIHK